MIIYYTSNSLQFWSDSRLQEEIIETEDRIAAASAWNDDDVDWLKTLRTELKRRMGYRYLKSLEN